MKNTNTPFTHLIQIKNRSGQVIAEKEVISLAGLLDIAHGQHLESVDTTIVQFPDAANEQTTIVRAVVKTARGTFAAIGDANPRNVAPQIAPHTTRMAETRAVARALRLAVNVGAIAIEELAGESDVTQEPPRAVTRANVPANDAPANDAPATAASSPATPTNGGAEPHAAPAAEPRTVSRTDSSRATDQQRRFLYRLLAERGIEGEDARTYVKHEIGVDNIADAPRAVISAFIDKLKNSNAKTNGNGRSTNATGGR